MNIDLKDFQTTGSTVFSGRPKGKAVRERLDIDQKDRSTEIFQIAIPMDILSVNSSFFLGLFGNSVRQLGEVKFREKYHFTCAPEVYEDIEAGIKKALERGNPLQAPE